MVGILRHRCYLLIGFRRPDTKLPVLQARSCFKNDTHSRLYSRMRIQIRYFKMFVAIWIICLSFCRCPVHMRQWQLCNLHSRVTIDKRISWTIIAWREWLGSADWQLWSYPGAFSKSVPKRQGTVSRFHLSSLALPSASVSSMLCCHGQNTIHSRLVSRPVYGSLQT